MKKTYAEWDGNHLLIHWFGMRCDSDSSGAHWREGPRQALLFEGLSESKAWKLSAKPTAEEALILIQNWQNSY